MEIPMDKAKCGDPRFLHEPPLGDGETISCHHSAACKASTPLRFEKAVKPAAKKKATKSISQEV